MRRVAVLVVGLLALSGCGRGNTEAFCTAAEELRVAHEDMLALVIEEGEPPLEHVRDQTARAATLSRRLAETAPDEVARQDYELIAEYQEQRAEYFASLTSANEAASAAADQATNQAFQRTEAFILEECGIDLWPQV